jgi:hypothetical protein
VYFSEIMWFREHFEATTYTIIRTEDHVCVLSCTIKLHVMKCIQQSNQVYQCPQNIILKRTHFNCNKPYTMWQALYSIQGTAYRIFCDASLILLKYFSIRRTTQISNLCLFLYHRASRFFMSVSVCSATGRSHLTKLQNHHHNHSVQSQSSFYFHQLQWNRTACCTSNDRTHKMHYH